MSYVAYVCVSVGLASELRDPAEPTEMPIGGTDFRRLKEPCDGEPDPHWKGHFVQQDPIGKDILMGNFAVRSPLEGAFRKGHFEVRHVLAMHSNVPSDDCGSGYSYRGGREVRRCAFFSHLLWTLVFPDCRFNLSEYYVGEHDKDYICSQLYEHGSDQPHRRRRSNRSVVFTDSLLANWSGLKTGPRLVISRVSCGYKYTVRLR